MSHLYGFPVAIILFILKLLNALGFGLLVLQLSATTATFQPGINLLQVLEGVTGIINRLNVILAVGSEKAQVLQILHSQQGALVEPYTQMGKQAVEEIEHVEADAALRAVGIQHPVGEVILVHRLADGVVVLGTHHVAAGGAVLVQCVVLVAHTGVAVLGTAWSPVVAVLAVGIGHVDKR